MKIKSYRAASLSQALMQIKQELGEDALVIETKQVRAGGFLGFGAQDLVEVRVTPNPKPKQKSDSAAALNSSTRKSSGWWKQQKSAAGSHFTRLQLTEDSDARPATPKEDDHAFPSDAVSALAARAYGSSQRFGAARAVDPTPGPLPEWTPPSASNREAESSRGIEIAETAPTAAYRRPILKTKVNADQTSDESPKQDSTRNPLTQEIGRLRAEVREIKFALGAMAPRANGQAEWGHGFDEERDLAQSPHYDLYRELTGAGVLPGLSRRAIEQMTPVSRQDRREARSIACEALANALSEWVQFSETALSVNAVAAFIGPTGVGKTTTIAKLAAHTAVRARRRVELITLDVYRIAAVQQLKTYAEIIGAGCHMARSVEELDELTRRFAGAATVLIDTTGRSPHDLADQMELADYLRRNQTFLKCLVLPATTDPTDAQLAVNKFALYGANRIVLTKLDETMQPGAAVGVAAEARLPLVYLCAGQRVPEDLERATPETLSARVMRPRVAAVRAR
jgi:flagellar biosynthesis protein FlhF